jgi:hypothetical protein
MPRRGRARAHASIQQLQQSMQQCACSRVRALFLRPPPPKGTSERVVHAAAKHATAATELKQCVRALFFALKKKKVPERVVHGRHEHPHALCSVRASDYTDGPQRAEDPERLERRHAL